LVLPWQIRTGCMVVDIGRSVVESWTFQTDMVLILQHELSEYIRHM
jgi:hypothetical protein